MKLLAPFAPCDSFEPVPLECDSTELPQTATCGAVNLEACCAMFRAHPDGMYWLEPVLESDRVVDFRLLGLNPAGATLLRLPERQVVGQPLSSLLKGGRPPQWLEDIRSVWERGGPHRLCLPLKDAAGLLPTRWFQLHLQRIADALLVLAREETDLRRAQRDLARAEERLRQTQSIAHVGSWSYDLRRGREWWSDEAYRICGINPGSFRPTYEAYLPLVHPDDRAGFDQAVKEAEEKRGAFSHEYRIVRPDGSERTVLTSGQVLLDERDEPAEVVGTVQDVTELRVNEQRARTSENLRRRIIDNAPIILFDLDAEGTVRFAEGRGLESQDLTPAQVIGHSIFELYAESPDFLANIRRALAGEALVVANETRGGVFERWLEPTFDEQGSVTGVVGVSLDVTERHRAEADLRASQALLRTVVDSVPHIIFVKDVDGRYVFANRALGEFHGLDPTEALGRNAAALPGFSPATAQHMDAMDRQVRQTGEAMDRSEVELTDALGLTHWLRVQKIPLPGLDGEITGVVGIGEDVTERRRIQQELEQSQALLQAIFDTFPARILVTGTDGRPVLVNRRQADELGLSPAEAVEQGVGCPPMVPADRRRKREELHAVVAEARSFDYERQRQDAKATEIYERVIRVPLYDAAGAISGALNVALDITAQKAAEAQLRQAQKMEAVGQLAGGVAHDFNNLLQVIQGYGQIAKMRTGDDAKLRHALEQISAAATRAGDLTRKLLTVSRRQVLRPRQIDLIALVDELMQMLGRLLGAHIELRQELAPAPLHVHADPGMVEQVLMNLCVNARDAMPDGGVLTLRTEPVNLDESLRRAHNLPSAGRYVRLTVSDTGTGMSPEVLQHVFEPFYTTKPEGQGTGLGLSTVYGIVGQHGGSIHVDSIPGHGTTFSVLLPAADAQATPVSAQSDVAIPRGSETVLVVEDEEHVLGLLVDLLLSQGYRALTARDGEAALETFHAHREEIALVILDVVMPKLGGREVASALRSEGEQVPILLSTGFTASRVDAEFIGRQSLSVLEKPYSPYELFRAVRDLLDGPRS
ncbi:MAG TPA: PAS domain S-box protein [bacterium]|nr:PAS domain S-box protein [bacterium]